MNIITWIVIIAALTLTIAVAIKAKKNNSPDERIRALGLQQRRPKPIFFEKKKPRPSLRSVGFYSFF